MVSSVLVSGKLGDLIHSMYVPHHLFERHGVRTKIYITDTAEHFENGIDNTYRELKPIIQQQKGNDGFEIWHVAKWIKGERCICLEVISINT